MGRRVQGRQPSLNSSVLTVTNSSIIDDEQKPELEYSEFVKRFGRPDVESKSQVQFVGYEETILKISNKIETLLKSEAKQKFALIAGPNGTGKTTVVQNLAEQYSKSEVGGKKLTFFYLKTSWTLEKQFGNPESRLRSLFDEAVQKAPALIFIDNIELIGAEKRSQNDSKDRVFNVIEDKLEYLSNMASNRVLVLAATDRPEILDPRLRKLRYFGEEIKFTLPKRQDRVAILKSLIKSAESSLSDEQIELVADVTHCYSYADLSNLYDAAQRLNQEHNGGPIDYSSFKSALSQYKPVAIKSITTPCPPLHWDDIGGVSNVKQKLQVSVIWPLEHRDKFKRLGIRPGKGALLYGPPGCSKTMLAQALATESGYNFISVKGPELFSKYVGDSEAAVRKLYRNAREIAPCIIFFDEIDGFAAERSDNHSSSVGDKVVATLLPELDGIEPLDDVFTIAATNRPERVDSALLRPGRLDQSIYIPLPSESDRREIFKVHMRPLAFISDESIETIVDKLSSQTSGYSGAEIAKVCRVAGELALLESLDNEHIEWRHLEAALKEVKPRTRPDHLKAYERFQEMSLQFNNGSSTTANQPSAPSVSLSHLGSGISNSNIVDGCSINGLDVAKELLAITKDINEDLEKENNCLEDVLSPEARKRSTLDRLMRSLRIKRRIR